MTTLEVILLVVGAILMLHLAGGLLGYNQIKSEPEFEVEKHSQLIWFCLLSGWGAVYVHLVVNGEDTETLSFDEEMGEESQW